MTVDLKHKKPHLFIISHYFWDVMYKMWTSGNISIRFVSHNLLLKTERIEKFWPVSCSMVQCLLASVVFLWWCLVGVIQFLLKYPHIHWYCSISYVHKNDDQFHRRIKQITFQQALWNIKHLLVFHSYTVWSCRCYPISLYYSFIKCWYPFLTVSLLGISRRHQNRINLVTFRLNYLLSWFCYSSCRHSSQRP